MGDEDPGTGTGGAGGAGGAPVGGAPPPGGQPPAPTPPPLPPRAAAPAPQNPPKKPKNGHQQPFDKHPGFRKRVDQEAARVIKAKLGCTLEEATTIIEQRRAEEAAAAAGAGAGAGGGAPPAAPRAGATVTEERLREELKAAQHRIAKQSKKIKRLRVTKSAEMTALEMRHEAVSSGIPDQYADFALDLYGKLWNAYSADPTKVDPGIKAAFDKDPIDGRSVFTYIRGKHIPAAPGTETIVPLDPTTAPPTSLQPGGEQPPIKPPATPEPQFDARKLNDAEWRAHKRQLGIMT